MRKILIMNNSLHGGGAERVLQTLLNHIDYQKYDITLYSVLKDHLEGYNKQIKQRYIFDKYDNKKKITKIKIKIINKIKLLIYKKSVNLFYKLFVRGRYDVEIAFIEGDSTKIISGSNNKRSKKYAWVHVDLSENHWTEIVYSDSEEEKKCYLTYDKIFCVSEAVKDSMNKLFGIQENVYVQHNPIDETRILQMAEKRVETIEQREKVNFITVGRLVPQKGYDRLLRVVSKLAQEGYQFGIDILGEGTEKETYLKYVEENNLGNYVRFLGFVENPYPYMKKADAFICSSRTEGYSTVICESIILGVPVITTCCSGTEEIIGGSGCRLIEENSEEGIYRGIKYILENPSELLNMQQKTQERKQIFTIKNRMREIEEILNG